MRYRGPCIGSCHRHDLFFLSRLHIGEEIIGIVIAEADNRIGDANRSFVRILPIRMGRSERQVYGYGYGGAFENFIVPAI